MVVALGPIRRLVVNDKLVAKTMHVAVRLMRNYNQSGFPEVVPREVNIEHLVIYKFPVGILSWFWLQSSQFNR